MDKDSIRIIISGGGTGGHIFPAVSIADALKKKYPKVDILFVGAEGRMEMTAVPKAGYRIVGVPIAGLQRSLSLKNLLLPFKIWKSVRQAKSIIKEFCPDVVVGFGGIAGQGWIDNCKAVQDISVWFGSRLSLNLKVEIPERIIISKARVPEFKRWLTEA